MSDETGLPDMFDPGKKALTGAAVLASGLPELPDVLTREMSIPVAFWAAGRCAAVLFLEWDRGSLGGPPQPRVCLGTFSRDAAGWAAHRHWFGHGWAHDPVTDPDGWRYPGEGAVIAGGGSGVFSDVPVPGHPASVVTGSVTPAVAGLALIQAGREDRRDLQSHFGAWIVCTERPGPFQVSALDATGAVIGSVDGPPRHQR